MICRHSKDDPSCSSHPSNQDTYAPTVYESSKTRTSSASRSTDPQTPDASKFEIDELEEVGSHLVAKVSYPNCSSCAFEGRKVLVYFDATYRKAALWRKIDPHFRDDKKKPPNPKEAPSPDARFPASVQGWQNAIAFARSKTSKIP